MKKKILYGICMLGMVALVATSCKKKEETTKSFGATHGAFQAVNVDDERAYLDPETYLTIWDTEDQFKVFNFENGQYAIFQVEDEGQNVGHFVNQGEDIGYASGYYAFYPAEMAKGDFDGVYQTFELDPIQYVHSMDENDYTFTLEDISIPQAAYTTYAQNHYYFDIIFGIANFKIKCAPKNNKPRYVQKIVVKDNRFNLCGSVRLKPNKINTGKLNEMLGYLVDGNDAAYAQKWDEYIISHEGDGLGYSAIGGGKELTYDFTSMNEGKGVALNAVDTRSLMVGLRPGALTYGFTLDIYVYDSYDGATKIVNITKYNGEDHRYTMLPAIIKNFGVGSITDQVNAQTQD